MQHNYRTGTFKSPYGPRTKVHIVKDEGNINVPVCSSRPYGSFSELNPTVDLNDVTCWHCQGWFDKNLRKLPKPNIEYQVLKSFISMIDIIDAVGQPEGPTKGQAAAFCAQMGKIGYHEHSQILLNLHFFEYVKSKGVDGQCFIKWLIKNKYIKEAFEPLTITINSENQFWSIYQRLNVNAEEEFRKLLRWELKNGKACRTMFNYLIKIKQNRKLKNPIS